MTFYFFRPPSHTALPPPALSLLLPAHIPNPKFPNHTKLLQAESRRNLSSLKPVAYQSSQCVPYSAKPSQRPRACLFPWLPQSLVRLVLHPPMVFHLLQGLRVCVCAYRWDCRGPQALVATQQNYLAAGLKQTKGKYFFRAKYNYIEKLITTGYYKGCKYRQVHQGLDKGAENRSVCEHQS